MKHLLLLLTGCFVAVAAGLCLLVCVRLFVCVQEAKARRNEQHARALQKGWSARQVVRAMGRPYLIRNSYFAPHDDSTFMYIYKSSMGASGDIELYLTKRDSVLYRIVTNG